MPMMSIAQIELAAIQRFGERLIRIFARNQANEPCTCGGVAQHLHGCPRHPWEIAQTLIQMEMDDERP